MDLTKFKIEVGSENNVINYTKNDVLIVQNIQTMLFSIYHMGKLQVSSCNILEIEACFLSIKAGAYPKIAKFENEVYILSDQETAYCAVDGQYLGRKFANVYEEFVVFESSLSRGDVIAVIEKTYNLLKLKYDTTEVDLKNAQERLTNISNIKVK